MAIQTSKKSKGDLIAALIMLVTGVLIMLSILVAELRWNYYKKNGIQVTAYITDIYSSTDSDGDSEYDVNIEYTYNDKKYYSKLNYHYESMKEGDPVQIFLSPKNPSEIITSPKKSAMLFMIPGGIFTFIGIIIFINYIKS